MYARFQMCMLQPHMCIHPFVHTATVAQRGRGRIARTSTECILWLPLKPTVRLSGEAGEGGCRMTGCDVITSASGCRKPYIKEVYVCGIKAKGVNRTEKALSAAPFRSTPSCASVARKKSPSSFRMIQPSSSECLIQEHLVNILNPGAFGFKLHHIAKCFL